jgi:6-phosphogluconolactonase
MPRAVNITYRVLPTPAATARAAAQLFSDAAVKAAASRGLARIAISGGTTPKTSLTFTGSTSAVCHLTMPSQTIG